MRPGSGYQVAGMGVWPDMKKGYLLRLNADGSVDGGPNTTTLDQVFDLALYANGKIAVAGVMGDRFAVGVHNPDGSWDAGFGDGGIARLAGLDTGSAASAMALNGYSRIMAAGSWQRPRLAANGARAPAVSF